MLTDVFRAMVNNKFLEQWLIINLKKVFMEKERKLINILTVFSIFYKSDIKTFL